MRYLSKSPVLRFFSALTLCRENATAYSYRLLRWLVLSIKNKKSMHTFTYTPILTLAFPIFPKSPLSLCPSGRKGAGKSQGPVFTMPAGCRAGILKYI